MWGFLTEFWDAITGVGEYTIEFFQNIGLAVAGAVGNLFDFALHFLNDGAVFFGWIGSILKEIVLTFVMPLSYVFAFMKSLLASAFATPVDYTGYSWDAGILGVFSAIPLWSTLVAVIGIALAVLVLFFVLRAFLRS
jgi:hypothetical protein